MSGSGERDQSVERLLRRSLRAPQPDGVTDSCLDAETLAAWVDGGLSGAALEMAQSHVADCARCQTLVGTLAQINVGVPPAEQERASRRWLSWLVPLTAAAAAVAIWVAVPRDTGAPLPQTTAVQKQAAETSVQSPRSLEDRPQAFASEPASGKVEQPAQRERKEQPAQKEQKGVSGANQVRVQAPEARRNAGRLATEDQQPQSAIAPSAVAPPAPAAPSAAATPLAADRAVAAVSRSTERSGQAPIEIVSPDPSVRWRIVRSVVQRSTDGGSRWDDVPTGSAAELTAGVAPSASVCWLVGRGGVVLLSADGRNWRRVAFPEAADLSAVRATDARTASVSTADGRTFSTTDAGATWVPR